MASELHVDAIKHSGGTSALTIDSSGNVSIPGAVVQIVQTNSNGQGSTTTTSTSFTEIDTDFRATITPKFASSKILFFCKLGIGGGNNGSHDTQVYCRLYDVTGGAVAGDSNASYGQGGFRSYDYGGSGHYAQLGTAFDLIIDSWGTTAKTFTFQVKKNAGDEVRVQDESKATSITIMEIAQ